MALPVANVARYELTLPSQQKQINFRPFLVKEEKILLMAMEDGQPGAMLNAMKEIVSACTFGEMKPDDYPMFDLEYVFLQIRAKSVGEIANLRILCPDDLKDKQYCDVKVDLTKIEVHVDETHTPNIIIDEARKMGVVMRYPGLGDIKGDLLSGDAKISDTYDMIANTIVEIYEGEESHTNLKHDEVIEFLEGLTSEQMIKLQKFYSSAPRLEHKVMVTNPKTKVESEVTLRGLSDFFA